MVAHIHARSESVPGTGDVQTVDEVCYWLVHRNDICGEHQWAQKMRVLSHVSTQSQVGSSCY